MTTPKIEAVAWMVGDEAFPSESLAIEEVRQWGPSGSIAKPVYSQQTVDALLAEVERAKENEFASLALLSRMRFACGDNGKRMQDELESYLAGLLRDAVRYRHISADHSAAWEEELDAAIGGRDES